MFVWGSPAEPCTLTPQGSDSYSTDSHQCLLPGPQPAGNAPLYSAAAGSQCAVGRSRAFPGGGCKSLSCKLRGAWAGRYQVPHSFPSGCPVSVSVPCAVCVPPLVTLREFPVICTVKNLTDHLSILSIKKKKKILPDYHGFVSWSLTLHSPRVICPRRWEEYKLWCLFLFWYSYISITKNLNFIPFLYISFIAPICKV